MYVRPEPVPKNLQLVCFQDDGEEGDGGDDGDDGDGGDGGAGGGGGAAPVYTATSTLTKEALIRAQVSLI